MNQAQLQDFLKNKTYGTPPEEEQDAPLEPSIEEVSPLEPPVKPDVSPERLPPRDRAREWSDSPQFPHGGRYRAGAVSPYGHELGADIDSSEQGRYSQSLAELTKSDDSDWDQRMVASFRESWDTRKQLTSAWDEVFALPGLIAPTSGLFLDKIIKGEDEPLRIGFPNARDMVQLLGEAQIALGMEAENGLLSGAPLGMILPLGARANRALGGGDFFGDETPMWDTAVQFYRERYDFTQPGWAEAFGEVLATDVAGVIGDFAAAASLAGLSAKGASVASKAAARASRQLGIKMDGRLAKVGWVSEELASKSEKFGELAEGFNRRVNQSMVSPEQLFNIAKAPGVLRALGRFGRRWGAADMELATLPFVAAAELWRMKLKRAGEVPIDEGLRDHILSQRKLEGVEIEMMARNPLPEMPTEMVDNAITANRGVRGSTVQLIGSTPKSPLNVMDAENTVFELDDIIYSHSSTGVANEVYPQEYQQRDRSTGESLDMVRDRAENLAPEMLIQNSSSVTEGSPILVLKDGKFYALGGNGRLMSMEIAYGGGRGQNYKDYLTEQASSLGLDSAQIQGMNKPVMVRVIKSELTETQRVEASRLFNLSAAEMQRAGEIAAEDVRQITPGLLLGFNLTTESSLDRMLVQPSNQQVLSDFINRLPESERASLLTDGAPNQQAVQRFTNAMIIRAYGDNPEFRAMLIETNEGLKNVQNAALGIAPKVIEMKMQIEQGMIPPTVDFTAALAEAVPFFNEILRNEVGAREATISEYYRYHEEQPDLFGTQAKRLTPEGTLFAHFLEQNYQKPRVMRETLTKYIDETLKDRDMFDSLPSKKELYRQAFEGRVSNLDELLEDVPDIAETTQNIETTVAEAGEQIEQARDTVDIDANTTEYSNRMIEILEGLGRNIDEQGQQVIEQAIQEARGTGQVSDESLFQIGRLGESLTVEVVDAIRQAFESEGRPTEWLDNLSIHAYGDIQRGLEESARLGEVDPDSAFPPTHQAYSYERLQQWDDMEQAARQAVEKDSTDVYAQAALGRALTHKGQFDEAIEVFDNLITNNPDDAYAHISRAETKRKMGDTEGADADIERAEEIQFGDPSEDTMPVDDARREFGEKVGAEERELTAEAATFRGLNHFKAGRYSQAIARAEEAVRLDPNNTLAHGILGYSYYGKGRASRRTGNMEESNTFFEDAANSFRKALEIEPDNVYSLNGMAWYHYRKGQHSQARYYREQARLAESGERMAGRGVAEIESELAEVQSTLQDLENRVTALEDSSDVEQLRTQADNLESELAEARSRESGEIDDAQERPPDAQDALTLLDEAEITIELNDEGQKVARYQGLDEDGNPHEVTTTFDADVPDSEVRQRTQELIDAEKQSYQQSLDEGDEAEPPPDEPPPDDDIPFGEEAVRQPSQLPLNQVEEFYQFLLDKAKDVDDPMLNEYVQALDGLTEDIVQGLAEIDPRIEGITDAFEDAKQIVGNKATFDYLDFIRNTLGNDVTDAPRYSNVVNQLMENIDSPENVQRILEQLSENDIDRFRGVVLQNMWERWADGGADDLAKLNENGQLEALLGTGIANSIRMWDEIVEDYIRPDPRPETAPDRPPEPETVADENLPRTPEGELPRKPEDILPEDELLPHEERAEHRLNIKRRRKAIVEAERNRTIRALANIRNSFAYRASLGFSAGAVGLGAYQGAGWLIAGGAFALVNAAALEAIVHIADKRNLRKSIREGVPHVEDAIQRGKGEPAIINLLDMLLNDAKRQNILPSLRILKESSQIREDEDEEQEGNIFGEFAR